MIAGNVNQPRALARPAQQFLHHVVVRLRPIPGRAQRPAVDDIADEVDRFCVVMAEEVEQPVGLTAARSQMDVGDEQRAKPSRGVIRHDTTLSDAMTHARDVAGFAFQFYDSAVYLFQRSGRGVAIAR